MDFAELIYKRQSVRRYKPAPVEKEKLLQCLEAARLAPSASNSQPWHYIVVDEPDLKNQVAHAATDLLPTINSWAVQAPVIVAVITEKPGPVVRLASRIKENDWSQIDTGISVAHFCLQAAELGLGTCMIGWFRKQRVKSLLNIPDEKHLSLLITLGYPADGYRIREKMRKPLQVITSYNRYAPKG